MSEDRAFYLTAKEAFKECLNLVGVPIFFVGIEKRCISDRVANRDTWQPVGFLPQKMVNVNMLDDDYAEYKTAGIESSSQAQVVFEEEQYQVVVIRSEPTDPTVELTLSISK
jgi:hypothetical protein